MTRFIKIFTILTGLTLMTACGASGVLDDLKSILDQAREALAAQEVTGRFLDEKIVEERFAALSETEQTPERRAQIEAEVAALVGEERAAAREAVADEVDEDSADYKAALAREVQYLGAVVGLSEAQIEARIRTCRATPNATGCTAVLTNVCYDTPFDTACDVNPDATRRTEYIAECGVGTNVGCIDHAGAACTGDSSIAGCAAFVPRVCDANPLYDVCDTADYFVARDNFCWIQGIDGGIRTEECREIFETNNLASNAIPACRANYVDPTGANRFNPRCYNVVIGVCDLNPFDVLCEENTNYLVTRQPRITACKNRVPNALFCAEATTFVCDDNPFDALCSLDYTANDYETERGNAITECGQTFVAGARCASAAVEFCVGKTEVTDLFNPLCREHSATDTARQPTCVSDRAPNTPISARCTETATRICDANPLDPLCEDVADYRTAQFGACVVTPEDPSCAVGTAQFSYITPIIECLSNPFGADCVNPTTEAGIAFAPNLEAAQASYCEGGATTKIATPDHVNCTNIGSLPNYPALASAYEFTVVSEFTFIDQTKVSKTALGGFLKTGVYGTGLGIRTGRQNGGGVGNPGTFLENTGNFARERNKGGQWVNLPSTTADNVESGHPLTYGTNPNVFTPAPAGTTPTDNFIQQQRIYEFTSPVDSKDGFIFFIARIDDENGIFPSSLSSYAGILSTSNFGAPLAVQPDVGNGNITAIWAGQFTAHVSDRLRLNAHPTDFYVDFTDRTFNIHNPTVGEDPKTGTATAVIGSGSALNDPTYYEASTFSYAVNGIFGVGVTDPNILYTNDGVARTLNAGELSGNVTFVRRGFDSREDWLADTTDGPPTTTMMPLTGLIGVEGAVGVYLNPNPSKSTLVGGFTASAPAPTN